MALKILIADDHPVIRAAVRHVIERHPTWDICGEAGNGQAAVDLVRATSPDVAILDVSMPELSGIEVTQRLTQDYPNTRSVLYTMYNDRETIRSGISAGARGFVLKSDGSESLEAAVSALGANRTYFSSSICELLLKDAESKRKRANQDFTQRELEIAQLVSEGNTNPQIASELGLSIKTIESHRGAVMRKANARTSVELVRFLIKQKLIAK
jgi:DNA-binding NarL/FixJ family response regulator